MSQRGLSELAAGVFEVSIAPEQVCELVAAGGSARGEGKEGDERQRLPRLGQRGRRVTGREVLSPKHDESRRGSAGLRSVHLTLLRRRHASLRQ